MSLFSQATRLISTYTEMTENSHTKNNLEMELIAKLILLPFFGVILMALRK